MTDSDDKIDPSELKKRIDELKKEEEREKIYDFGVYEFISSFNIFEVAVGTIMGFSTNRIIKDLSHDVIRPIIKKLFLNDFINSVEIFGVKFDAEKIISDVVYLIFVLILMYFIFRFLLKNVVGRMIREKKTRMIKAKKDELYHMMISKDILDVNKKTLMTLENMNKHLEEQRKNQKNELRKKLETISGQIKN